MTEETKTEKEIEQHRQEIKKLRSQLREAKTLIKNQFKFFGDETRRQIVTLTTSAFGFVAALIWRDAVQAFFVQTFQISPGQGGAWINQVYVALLVTIFVIIATITITKMMRMQPQPVS